jgi:hypothetical protein
MSVSLFMEHRQFANSAGVIIVTSFRQHWDTRGRRTEARPLEAFARQAFEAARAGFQSPIGRSNASQPRRADLP